MKKINVLDSTIYNLISAGEVVERPRSVVKELVENSLDAGAKSVSVGIKNGGKTEITVSDDGSGISKEYVKTAFLPHATSKISSADDLNGISSLGFRGEALASVASVAMVTLITKTKEEETATAIGLDGGKVVEFSDGARPDGTTVTVKNLFYNTPARYKFLKSDKGEETEITALVADFILANPNVSFIYKIDDKIKYQSDGKGLNSAIYSVYSREIIMNFVKIENTYNEFSISGYISNPTFFKGNRTYQTMIINGRIVENKTIQTAVEKAYEGYLMKRCFPLYIVNISMPSDFLDVNVHPSKTDVRFSDNNKVFGFVYHSVRKFLDDRSAAKNVSQIEYVGNDDIIYENAATNSREPDVSGNKSESLFNEPRVFSSGEETDFDKDDLCGGFRPCGEFAKSGASGLRSDSGIAYRVLKAAESRACETRRVENNENFDKTDFSRQRLDFVENSDETIDFDGKIVGQIFDTYIIVEKENEIYIIDQHAAHERVLFDELNKFTEKYTQPLLLPYVFDVNSAEADFMEKCLPQLNEIGFDIEPFGNYSYKVSGVPAALADINFDRFFAEILGDLAHSPIFKTNDLLKDKLAQIACKSAIKGGNSLNSMQIEALIQSFKTAEKVPSQCPHGRPCVIRITKTDLEKWFKRVL